jgi:hypothetical protein
MPTTPCIYASNSVDASNSSHDSKSRDAIIRRNASKKGPSTTLQATEGKTINIKEENNSRAPGPPTAAKAWATAVKKITDVCNSKAPATAKNLIPLILSIS